MKLSVAFVVAGTLALSLAAVVLSGCETQSPLPQSVNTDLEQCLDTHQILSVLPQNSRTIDVVTHSNDAYELQLSSPCLDVQAQSRPAIIPRNGALVCGQGDADVSYAGYSARSPQICRVVSVRQMSPNEAADLVGGKSL